MNAQDTRYLAINHKLDRVLEKDINIDELVNLVKQ